MNSLISCLSSTASGCVSGISSCAGALDPFLRPCLMNSCSGCYSGCTLSYTYCCSPIYTLCIDFCGWCSAKTSGCCSCQCSCTQDILPCCCKSCYKICWDNPVVDFCAETCAGTFTTGLVGCCVTTGKGCASCVHTIAWCCGCVESGGEYSTVHSTELWRPLQLLIFEGNLRKSNILDIAAVVLKRPTDTIHLDPTDDESQQESFDCLST